MHVGVVALPGRIQQLGEDAEHLQQKAWTMQLSNKSAACLHHSRSHIGQYADEATACSVYWELT